nr:MAG TPA: hypothetical protein [Caudoviricetes sp.]
MLILQFVGGFPHRPCGLSVEQQRECERRCRSCELR